jgi:XisI protein
MENLKRYENALKSILQKYQSFCQKGGSEVQMLMDSTNQHYQLLHLDWENHLRTYTILLHFDIKDGKIWLQQNNTDFPLDDDFQSLGIQKNEIVNGLYPEKYRHLTDYAVV